MRHVFTIFALTALLTVSGCAASFHAGGRNGVDAGAAVGPPPVIIQDVYQTNPLPVPQ